MNSIKNIDGIYDIPKEKLKKINGGILPIVWFGIGLIAGAIFGSIEDFNAGREAARQE